MSCTKNPKKFLFIKYNGPHKWINDRVRRFGSYSWHQFTVVKKCSLCNVSSGERVLTESEMVEQGYNVEKLNALSSRDLFSKNAEDLK